MTQVADMPPAPAHALEQPTGRGGRFLRRCEQQRWIEIALHSYVRGQERPYRSQVHSPIDTQNLSASSLKDFPTIVHTL